MASRVSDFGQAISILRDTSYLNARHAGAFRRLRARSGAPLRETERFFEDWLMYMDGPRHSTVRSKVLSLLSKQISHFDPTADVQHMIAEGVFCEAGITVLVSKWHAGLFGITISQQQQAFALVEPLMQFLLHRETRSLLVLDECVNSLESWVRSQHFSLEGLAGKMIQSDIPLGTMINLLVDSYEPVKVALINLLFLAGRRFDNDVGDEFVWETLRVMPPFRYINRLCPDGAEAAEKVSIDVLACNNVGATKPSLATGQARRPSLSFGRGAHHCVGFAASIRFLEAVWGVIDAHLRLTQAKLESSGTIDTDNGLCRILGLQARIRAEVMAEVAKGSVK